MYIKIKKLATIRFSVLFFVVSNCLASPTADEFIPCGKMAVEVLKQCLLENPYYENDVCWQRSKDAYELCSKSVFQDYNSDEIQARRERAEQLKQSLDR
ncbi:hypothetical protein A9Q79_04775 [Methylophaga sp. 42_25_T18]|nr:hypothetical protein A9Q79_04775 [Methylophaga sp. 42_25_T18]